MPMIQLAGNGFGGVIHGAYGNYQAAADGTFTVDARDAPTLLVRGMAYVGRVFQSYTLPHVPGAALPATIVASGALSNGTVAIARNPNELRQVQAVVGAGTLAITAGTVAVTYVGNDGLSGTDTLSLITAASGTSTLSLSRGVNTISTITVSGLVGGASPYIEFGTTAALSVPVAPNAVDFAVQREYDAGATIAVGALVNGVLGTIIPTTAPNGTVTYSFAYSYVAPTS